MDAAPQGLSARVSALGKRRPPSPVNANLAMDLPHKCFQDWQIPILPVPSPAAGAAAAAAAGANASAADETGEWHFVKVEHDSSGREIQKRGWIATRPGAKGTLHMSTAWNGEGIDGDALVGVTLGCGAHPVAGRRQVKRPRRS